MNIEKALEYATRCHKGQKRKYTGEDYINHPYAVMKILEDYDVSVEVKQAALLHDVIEDCGVTRQDLLDSGFSVEVADMVVELSDISKPSDGNRAVRKEIDRQHLSKASNNSKTIKLADIIDNTSSIVENDKKFAKVYLRECLLLLEVLVGGNKELWYRCKHQVVGNILQLIKEDKPTKPS